MGRPIFEDKYPQHNSGNYYTITNEEPELFAKMLGKQRFKRSAGIASGGEIPIQVLLPRSDEVLAIDHAYQPLAYSYMKTLLVESLGIKKFQQMLINQKYTDLVALIDKLCEQVPAPLKQHMPPGLINQNALMAIRKEWCQLDRLGSINRKLHKLKLIHGDITDLGQYGQVDCLYVSNAMQHADRTGKYPNLQSLEPLVAEGGILLSTGGPPAAGNLVPACWKLVQNIIGFRTSWNHCLWTKNTPVTAGIPGPVVVA